MPPCFGSLASAGPVTVSTAKAATASVRTLRMFSLPQYSVSSVPIGADDTMTGRAGNRPGLSRPCYLGLRNRSKTFRPPAIAAVLQASFRASHDPRGLVAPIAVAQQALVEFAGRQPRQFRLEIDRARHLLPRQRPAAEVDQFVGELRPRRNAGHRLHHRLHLFA